MTDPIPKQDRKIRSHPGWHVLGAGLVAGWLLVMAWMFGWGQAHGDIEKLTAGDLPGSLVEEEFWMGAYFQGRKLGYLHTRVHEETGGFRLEQQSRLYVHLAGTRQEVSSNLRAFLADGFVLKTFGFSLQMGMFTIKLVGKTRGMQLEVEVHSGEQVHTRTWPMHEPPLFDLTIPRILARRELESGQRYQVTVFDPRTMSNQPAEIEVVAREPVDLAGSLVPSIHLRRSPGGHRVDTWIDERGGLLKESWEIGLEFRREEEKIATMPIARSGSGQDEAPELFRWLMPDSSSRAEGKGP